MLPIVISFSSASILGLLFILEWKNLKSLKWLIPLGIGVVFNLTIGIILLISNS